MSYVSHESFVWSPFLFVRYQTTTRTRSRVVRAISSEVYRRSWWHSCARQTSGDTVVYVPVARVQAGAALCVCRWQCIAISDEWIPPLLF
jgi:hypothetical protein